MRQGLLHVLDLQRHHAVAEVLAALRGRGLRLEDPDTLFFSRRLVIEGDTELGLALKNALDAASW